MQHVTYFGNSVEKCVFLQVALVRAMIKSRPQSRYFSSICTVVPVIKGIYLMCAVIKRHYLDFGEVSWASWEIRKLCNKELYFHHHLALFLFLQISWQKSPVPFTFLQSFPFSFLPAHSYLSFFCTCPAQYPGSVHSFHFKCSVHCSDFLLVVLTNFGFQLLERYYFCCYPLLFFSLYFLESHIHCLDFGSVSLCTGPCFNIEYYNWFKICFMYCCSV